MASSKNQVIGIIPARYASTRFPGKPLAMINGMSMIERVFRQASLCEKLSGVIVATDDDRIFNHVQSFGGRVMLTSTAHKNGTDRLAEVITNLENNGEYFNIAINIQGDEPFIQPEQIEKVIDIFSKPEAKIGTLVKAANHEADILDPNVVKVVLNNVGKALYFSRSPIPYIRNGKEGEWNKQFTFYKHIGIYGYLTGILKELVQLEPSPLEKAESLEQLRWIYNGYEVFASVTDIETFGIDTPEDLSKLINNPC